MASLIHPSYDLLHRARFMADERTVFDQLHLRSGAVHEKMEYDERYTEYIRKTGLLPFVSLVSRSMSKMNPCAITALVDRWRPETHTFHFFGGEVSVTLQDVTMISGLPIKGEPICFSTDSEGWHETMVGLIGKEPGVQGKSAGASYHWIAENFSKYPDDVDDETVQQYCRAYLWYVVSRTLFSDGTGVNASFMWLKLFAGWEHGLSWGTTALAYLYRQVTSFA